MKKKALFVAVLAISAAMVSCEKPLEDLDPSLENQVVAINSGETVNVGFTLNDVRGNTISYDLNSGAAEQYDIKVTFDEAFNGGTVAITAPALILDDTPFDINLSFKDNANNRLSSAKITVNPTLVNGLVKFSEPANSFIVAPGAVAVFPTKKGNSGTDAAPASIQVEWQDNAGLFVDALKVGNGEAIVRFAQGKEGNVVLNGVDAAGNVVWSWLFWVASDTPKDVTVGGSTFMDRNIGALNLDEKSDLSVGVVYQYGRKDPFPGLRFDKYEMRTIYDGAGQEKTITITKNEAANNIDNTIKNPGVFYNNVYVSGQKHNYSWITTDATTFGVENFKALWENDGKKSMYDPCPAGYKVASVSNWADVKASTDITELWDSSYETPDASTIGTNDKYVAGNRKKVQFRGCIYSGLRLTVSGEINSNSTTFSFANCVGKALPTAAVWCANTDPDFTGSSASYFRGMAAKVNTSGNGNYDDISAITVNALSNSGKYGLNYALPVRCIREK